MPNEHINKVEIYRNSSTQTLIDITDTTATASDVAQGKYFYLASGERVAGTSSGGSGDGYILTTIVPQTTFTPNSSRQYVFSGFTTGLVEGESYLVTLDGDEYLVTCGLMWTNNYLIGDDNVIFSTGDHVLPFCIDWVSAADNMIVVLDTQQHTVKVEHIELVSPTVLTTKTITTNGTYNAADDNATGYSSVTVNVSGGGGGGNYQAKTNINPTTSSQTIRPDTGYDALSSVQINAMPTGTAGTPTATKGSVSNHSVSVTPSVTNTTGYITGGTKTGTAVTVSASELVSGNKAITANGNNIDVADYATVSVNVSGGSSMNAQSAQSTTRSTSTSYTEVISLTCSRAGTYDVYWTTFRSSTSGTWGSQLYLGNTAYGTADTGNWSNHVQNKHLTGVSISANQAVSVRVRSRGSNYYGYVGTLTIIQTA